MLEWFHRVRIAQNFLRTSWSLAVVNLRPSKLIRITYKSHLIESHQLWKINWIQLNRLSKVDRLLWRWTRHQSKLNQVKNNQRTQRLLLRIASSLQQANLLKFISSYQSLSRWMPLSSSLAYFNRSTAINKIKGVRWWLRVLQRLTHLRSPLHTTTICNISNLHQARWPWYSHLISLSASTLLKVSNNSWVISKTCN